jgi:hypothetical protein
VEGGKQYGKTVVAGISSLPVWMTVALVAAADNVTADRPIYPTIEAVAVALDEDELDYFVG